MQLPHFPEINLLSYCNFIPTKMKYSPSVPYYHSLRFLPFYSVEIYWICLRDKADIKWSLVSVPHQTFLSMTVSQLQLLRTAPASRKGQGCQGQNCQRFSFFSLVRPVVSFSLPFVIKNAARAQTNHDTAMLFFARGFQ